LSRGIETTSAAVAAINWKHASVRSVQSSALRAPGRFFRTLSDPAGFGAHAIGNCADRHRTTRRRERQDALCPLVCRDPRGMQRHFIASPKNHCGMVDKRAAFWKWRIIARAAAAANTGTVVPFGRILPARSSASAAAPDAKSKSPGPFGEVRRLQLATVKAVV